LRISTVVYKKEINHSLTNPSIPTDPVPAIDAQRKERKKGKKRKLRKPYSLQKGVTGIRNEEMNIKHRRMYRYFPPREPE
jgi:hypothetical protein